MAKGAKTCPKCNAAVGARTKVCKCGYNFFRLRPTNVTKKQVKKEANYVPQKIKHYAEGLYTRNICYHGLAATLRILKAALQMAKQEKERRGLKDEKV